MNEAKQMSARSVPQGSTSISSNLGGNANGVVMPTASTSTHFNGGSATAFLSPTKPDMVKMSQSLKASQAQKSQFKSVQVISQQSNLSGPSGTNCVVLQHVGGGNSSHNLAFSSMVDNNQAQGSPMYQSSSQAFLSPPRPVQNPTNATGNQTSDGNHVQMQTAQIPARYTHIDGRQVQMIQLNNNQYYQVGQGGQPIAIQQYVQQPQQQFVTRNGSVVFASQANQDGSRILQALPTQVHIQNTVSPQNTSFHLTKTALKNVKSVNQSPSSTRRSDPLQPAPAPGAATSSSQYMASSQPSSSSTAYEKSPASSAQVFSPPPAKPKNRSRSSKSKSKASPQQQQQQVVTQTQHVTNNNGQPTATIQQIALPANSNSRNQVQPSNNQASVNDASSKNSNHQSGSSQQAAASQQHGPSATSSQPHGSMQQRGSSMAPSQQHGTSAPSNQQHGNPTPSSQQHGPAVTSSQQFGSSTASSQQQPEYSNNKQQLHPPQTPAGPPPKSPNTQAMPPPPLPTVRPIVPPALPNSSSKPMPPPSTPNSSASQQQTPQPASSTAGSNTQQVPPPQGAWKLEKVPTAAPNQQQRKILHARRPPPGKQQTVPQTQQAVPQGQHIRLQNGQIIQLKQPLTQSISKIPTKEELEKKAMPPPPVPAPKPRVTVLPPVPPPVLTSPLPSDLDTVWERALNFAFNSNAPKWSFNQMRSHFRRLIYENECYQSQLREYHQRLLKLERDNNYLMDRLLPYENISSSDGEDSDSSTKTIEERVVVQKLTKKRPAHRPSGSAPPKKKGASSKPVAPPTNGVPVPPPVAPAPKPKAPAAAPATSTAASVAPKVAPASSQPAVSSQATTSASQVTVVSAGQGSSKTTPIKFPPRSASRLPTAPSLTKSMASVVSPLTKAGLSNNPAMKQQMTRAVPNVVRHGQPLLSSLIKSGTSQPQSITITSPLAKASLTIPSSPLAKNSVTIPPPRGPVAVVPNRFPRPELSAGGSSSQLMPPPSGLPRKLVFDKPTAPLPIRNYTSTTSSSASGSGEPVFVTPLPKNYNNGATAAAKKSPAKAKVVISELPKTEGVKTSGAYPIRAPMLPSQGFVRAMTPAESKKYMLSSARVMTTNPTPLSNATVTYTSLKPTPGSPSKIVVHQQSAPAPKRPSTMPLAVITSMATPPKKPNTDHTLRSPPYASMPLQLQPQQQQQHLESSPQRNTAHHTVSASTPEVTRPLPSTERPPPSSNNGP